MTDYGRGPASEPWHPEDPLFGDHYGPQQPQQSQLPQPLQDGWDQYAAGPQQPQYPYEYQPQQSASQEQYQQQYDPYAAQQQPRQPEQQYQYDAWGNVVVAPAAYGAGPGDPYHDPYGGGQQPDFYGQGGYPPPQQPQYREQQPQQPQQEQQQPQPQPQPQPQQEQQQPQQPAEPGTTGEWHQSQPEEPEHAFFADAGDEGRDGYAEDAEDDAPAGRRDQRRGGKKDGKKKGTKRRSGMACLVVLVVLGGGVGGAGYAGYRFYKSHFGAPEDFAGKGTKDVQVEVPTGAGASEIAVILQKAGVVKSTGAFIAAANADPESLTIQPGVFVLRDEMSAKAALAMMLDPTTQNVLIIPEGTRAVQVYTLIDKKLGQKAGTTAGLAKEHTFELPDYADDSTRIKDPLDGFLFPARYSVGAKTKPVELLQKMVDEAEKQYAKYGLEAAAKKYGLDSPLDVITVASLVQAEGKTADDFQKMARVVYNRLEPNQQITNGYLEFDSTYNYLKNQSKINLTVAELRNYDDPYNTYFVKGLPPGPIGNPGAEALDAATAPASGKWYFFVSVDGEETQFTETLAEHDELVKEFNEKQGQ